MKKEKIEQLTDEELNHKLRSTKQLMWIFVGLIAALLFFEIKAYLDGEGVSPMSIITLCTVGGLVSMIPDFKKLKEESKHRI